MSTTGTTSVTNTSRFSELADKHLFTAVFFIGTALTIVFKSIGAPQLLVTAASLLCMLIYGGYILFTPRYRIRNDRAGDSIYYLGFLFTMVSLAYSLWQFSSDR